MRIPLRTYYKILKNPFRIPELEDRASGFLLDADVNPRAKIGLDAK